MVRDTGRSPERLIVWARRSHPTATLGVTRITVEVGRERATARAEVRVVEGGRFPLVAHPLYFLEHMQGILGIASVESEAI